MHTGTRIDTHIHNMYTDTITYIHTYILIQSCCIQIGPDTYFFPHLQAYLFKELSEMASLKQPIACWK